MSGQTLSDSYQEVIEVIEERLREERADLQSYPAGLDGTGRQYDTNDRIGDRSWSLAVPTQARHFLLGGSC